MPVLSGIATRSGPEGGPESGPKVTESREEDDESEELQESDFLRLPAFSVFPSPADLNPRIYLRVYNISYS